MSKILRLNDDCLLQICKRLGLTDQMSLALTHSRCAAVIQMGQKYKHKSVNLKGFSQLTSCQVKEFFRLFGSTVEEINGDDFEEDGEVISDDTVDSMKKYCNNVKLLRFQNCNLRGRLPELLLRMQQITELHLRYCSLEDKDIPDMPNLIMLKICENDNIKGSFLGRLTTVQHLNLDYCRNVEPCFIMDAMKSMKMLQSMDLEFWENVTSDILQEITKSCHKLEVLKIEFDPGVEYECLAQLPSLKDLELYGQELEPALSCHKLLKALVKYKAHQLEHFGVESLIGPEEAMQLGLLEQLKYLRCSFNRKLNDRCLREFAKLRYLEELDLFGIEEVTADGLLHLLGQCTKLMRLNIAGCDAITNAFVYQAIDVLGGATAERSGPVEMDVYLTGITEAILDETKYTGAASLLKLNFD